MVLAQVAEVVIVRRELVEGLRLAPVMRLLSWQRTVSNLACSSGHEQGGFPAGSAQLQIEPAALPVRHSSVKPRTRGSGDIGGHALNVGLRQLARGAGADEPGLLAGLVSELPDNALSRGAEGGHVR